MHTLNLNRLHAQQRTRWFFIFHPKNVDIFLISPGKRMCTHKHLAGVILMSTHMFSWRSKKNMMCLFISTELCSNVDQLETYHIQSNYRTYPYKRTVKNFRSLQITASVIFLYFFLKAYVVGTHLNCIDLSMQFKWVPTTYAFIKKIRNNHIIIIK